MELAVCIHRLSLRSSQKRLQWEVGVSVSAGSHRREDGRGEQTHTGGWGGGSVGVSVSVSKCLSSRRERRRIYTLPPATWGSSRRSAASRSCTTRTATCSAAPSPTNTTTSWESSARVRNRGQHQRCGCSEKLWLHFCSSAVCLLCYGLLPPRVCWGSLNKCAWAGKAEEKHDQVT